MGFYTKLLHRVQLTILHHTISILKRIVLHSPKFLQSPLGYTFNTHALSTYLKNREKLSGVEYEALDSGS